MPFLSLFFAIPILKINDSSRKKKKCEVKLPCNNFIGFILCSRNLEINRTQREFIKNMAILLYIFPFSSLYFKNSTKYFGIKIPIQILTE